MVEEGILPLFNKSNKEKIRMKQANPKKKTYRYCNRCGKMVQYERVLEFPFYCANCNENMYNFETHRKWDIQE